MRQVSVDLVMMDRNRRLSPASVLDSDAVDVSGMSLMWVRNGILHKRRLGLMHSTFECSTRFAIPEEGENATRAFRPFSSISV